MHKWGDEGVDWAGIEAAAEWIGEQLMGVGIGVTQTKEKFGQARVYLEGLAPDQHADYRRVYLEALEKWPHLKEEILQGADFREVVDAPPPSAG